MEGATDGRVNGLANGCNRGDLVHHQKRADGFEAALNQNDDVLFALQ